MRVELKAAVVVTAMCGGSLYPELSAAQETIKPLERPDPGSVSVPNMTVALSAKDGKDFDSHYYFFKQGATYERAFADLDQCRLYGLETSLFWPIPRFIPLGGEVIHEDEKSKLVHRSMLQGIAGAIIASYVIESKREDYREATIRRCMAFKGYIRYGTSPEVWKQIEAGTESQKFARWALIASGSQPHSEAIGP